MPDRAMTPGQVLTLLQETPLCLAALTVGLTPARLHTAPAPDEWSANDVPAHLRACADVWGGCIARIIAEDTPTLRAVSPRTWINKTSYCTLEFQPSLHAFATQRADLVSILGALSYEG